MAERTVFPMKTIPEENYVCAILTEKSIKEIRERYHIILPTRVIYGRKSSGDEKFFSHMYEASWFFDYDELAGWFVSPEEVVYMVDDGLLLKDGNLITKATLSTDGFNDVVELETIKKF